MKKNPNSHSLHVAIPKAMKEWMDEQIKDGRYLKYSEIVRDGLALLRRSEVWIPKRE